MWAARCHARDFEIKVVGRWAALSHSYLIYVGKGRMSSNRATMNGGVDPITKLWMFKPCTLHAELTDRTDIAALVS